MPKLSNGTILNDLEWQRNINDTKHRAVSVQQLSWLFHAPCSWCRRLLGYRLEYCDEAWCGEWCGYPTVKRFEEMFNGFDTVPACDRQVDRQTDRPTSCGSIVGARGVRELIFCTHSFNSHDFVPIPSHSHWNKKCFKMHGEEWFSLEWTHKVIHYYSTLVSHSTH